MRREDLIAFARRDWQSVTAAKERFWAEEKRRMTATEAIRLSGDLLAAASRRIDWPSADERQADLAMHARVSEDLQRVRVRTG
jgi:hypothetical protein